MKKKCHGCNKTFTNMSGDFCHKLCEKDYRELYKPCPICHEKDIRITRKACSGCNAKIKAQKNNWDKSSRKCHICDISFKPSRKTSKTCSKVCSTKYRTSNRTSPKPSVKASCEICGTEFSKAGLSMKKTCSKICSKKLKNIKTVKSINRNKSPITKRNCSTCDIEFMPESRQQRRCNPKCKKKSPPKPCKCGSKLVKGNKLYCDLCKPKKVSKPRTRTFCKKAYKKAQKLKCRQAKLANVSWKDIQKVYDECPEGMEVDHIIPRNHDKVCGLHVPWNLQYLSPEENRKKSNKFPYLAM